MKEQVITGQSLLQYLAQLSPEELALPIGREDGQHDYWGTMFRTVTKVEVSQEQINGPKQADVRCILIS